MITFIRYHRLPFNCGIKLLRYAALQADCGAFFGDVTFFMAALDERPVFCAVSIDIHTYHKCIHMYICT